jgi:hypothetical protein
MCKIAYIVADRPLPEFRAHPSRFAPRHGIEPLPVLTVEALTDGPKELVAAIAGGEFVYVANSWEGCGCGFAYESSAEFEASLTGAPPDVRDNCTKMREECRQSVAALAEYLREVTRGGPVTLYVAQAGAEGRRTLRAEQTVSSAHFGGEEFYLREDELYDVVTHNAA